jgi:hypothetical protein
LKLSGQEEIARDALKSESAGDAIARYRDALDNASTIDDVRILESRAAASYWDAWKNLVISFPKIDSGRIPRHWQTFGTRRSPISGTTRRAPNPANAVLNYLYSMLESETRIAINTMGLDAGFGLLHVDHATRDSLVYDLMEPVRPMVDRYLFELIKRGPFSRSWFVEERDGCVRLKPAFAMKVSSTMRMCEERIAPIVEWFVESLAAYAREYAPVRMPGTRLTQRRRFQISDPFIAREKVTAREEGVCSVCGGATSPGNQFCHGCSSDESGKRLAQARTLATDPARTPESLAVKSKRMKAHRDSIAAWNTNDLPDWLTDDYYSSKIHPVLASMSKTTVADALGVSKDYVYQIVSGKRVPHRRHWVKLAQLAAIRSV